MNYIVAALMCLFCGFVHAADQVAVHVGTVEEMSSDAMMLDSPAGGLSIGFVSTPAARRALKKIRLGNKVFAIFGTAVAQSGQHINKLIAIRICRPVDTECSVVIEEETMQAKRLAIANAIADKKRAQCSAAMAATLAQDSRYVPDTKTETPAFTHAKYLALSSELRACVNDFREQHHQAILDACTLHQCGANTGGGCSHIAGRAGWRDDRSAIAECTK
jgi:choline dehydrogenase-like flavoprotein